MVRIRLRRMGKTKQPSYRVVVADSRSPRDGRFIEIIGHYNPIRQPKVLEIKHDRARYWLGVGASPSESVVTLFKRVNILDAEGNLVPAEAESDTEAGAAEQPAAAPAEISTP
jgi:small subunit ribosomal protein S16